MCAGPSAARGGKAPLRPLRAALRRAAGAGASEGEAVPARSGGAGVRRSTAGQASGAGDRGRPAGRPQPAIRQVSRGQEAQREVSYRS